MTMPPGAGEERPRSSCSTVLAVIAVVGGLVVLAVVLFPLFFGHGHGKSRRILSLSNMRQVGLAVQTYAAAHDERYPPSERWSDAVAPYVRHDSVFQVELEDKTVVSPAMNDRQSLKPVPSAALAAEVVVLFETLGPGKNLWGGPTGAWAGHGDKKLVGIGFADTHVKFFPRPQVFGLKWE